MAGLLAATPLIAPPFAAHPPITQQTAQPVSTASAPQIVRAAASVTGIVRAAATQAPVARARVTLSSDKLPAPRVAITGADGRYAFDKLPPGVFTVQASASGYAARAHGQQSTGAPATIRIGEAQQVSQIDIDLPAAGVIVGRILDEDQRPFVGASVEALAPRTENAQPTLVSMARTVTDDRGEFRLAGLLEGHYYVSAFDPAFAEAGDETGRLFYTATYYPGVVQLEEAQRVAVTPGAEPRATIVFALKIVRPARVSGLIATPDRKQLTSGAVIMTPVHGEGLSSVPSDDVTIKPDGRFTFRNVAPGRYQVMARAQTEPQGVTWFSAYRLLVEGRDIAHIDLALSPGAIVAGMVTFEGREARPPRGVAGIRVRAPFVDGSTFGDALTGDVGADGRFRIRGVMSGRHYLTVEGLAHPWVLKDVRWRGEDVTDRPLDFDARQVIEDVQVTVTDVANEVRGTVKDSRGRPVPDALVAVFPLAPQFWTRGSRRFAVLRSDASGQYSVRGLPAGEYRAFASLDVDESEIHRRELLEEFSERGQPLNLGSPQAHVLDLGVTPPARAKRTPGF